MAVHVVLLRGIHVGGSGKLPMKELRRLLEGLGATDVTTYIQSGNAVLRHRSSAKALAASLRTAIEDAFGFAPEVLALSPAQLERAAAANPFPEGEDDPAKLHLSFLAKEPTAPQLGKLETLRAGRERFALVGSVFYLHAPDGVARSKLAAGAEKALGVPATARNWRTVQKLRELAEALA